MKYVEHLSWLLFLHFLDAQEEVWEAALAGRPYERILDGDLRWSIWARKDWKADELLPFVHGRLIPYWPNGRASTTRRFWESARNEQHRLVEYPDGVQAQVTELKRLQAESAEPERVGAGAGISGGVIADPKGFQNP